MFKDRAPLYIIALLVILVAGSLVNTAIGSPLPLPPTLTLPAAAPAEEVPSIATTVNAPAVPTWSGEPALSIWRSYTQPDWGLQFDHPVNWEPRQTTVAGELAITLVNAPALTTAPVAPATLSPDHLWLRITRHPAPGILPLDRWVADFQTTFGEQIVSGPTVRYLNERPGRQWTAVDGNGTAVRQVALRDANAVYLVTIAPANHAYETAVNAIVDSLTLERP